MQQLYMNALGSYPANAAEHKAAARIKFYVKKETTEWGLSWAPDEVRIEVPRQHTVRSLSVDILFFLLIWDVTYLPLLVRH